MVLAALAHPLRVALLYQLTRSGPRTASQCAQALGETRPTAATHLRQLAKAGLVARDAAGNGPASGPGGRSTPGSACARPSTTPTRRW